MVECQLVSEKRSVCRAPGLVRRSQIAPRLFPATPVTSLAWRSIALACGIAALRGVSADAQTGFDPASLRATYDSGFARIVAALPANASDRGSPLWPLWAVARFRRVAVAWADLRQERYYPLVTGPRALAWLVIVPPDNPARARMRGTLQLDATANLLVAQIAPEQVTPEWAGIFLSHLIQVLADYALGATNSPPTDDQYYATEFRSYQIELISADLVSAGRVRVTIDSLLSARQVTAVDDLVPLVRAPTVRTILPILNTIAAPPAASSAEQDLRNGFVVAAVVVRYCERSGLDLQQTIAVMRRVFPRDRPQ